jgi:hypothetical protein
LTITALTPAYVSETGITYFFFLLLFTGFISMLYVSIFSFWFLIENWVLPGKMPNGLTLQLTIGVVITLLSILIMGLVGHLSGYHIFITTKGQTTNERILTKRRLRTLGSQKSLKKNGNFKIEAVAQEPLLGTSISPKSVGSETNYILPVSELKNKEVKQSKSMYSLLSSDGKVAEL